MVRCSDGSLYTGIAVDVEKRLRQHETGKQGSRYLRGRAPLRLVYTVVAGSRSTASRLEYLVKRLPKRDKEALVSGAFSIDELLAQLDGDGSTA